jgi:hypothetical protein
VFLSTPGTVCTVFVQQTDQPILGRQAWRRGCATILNELTGSANASYQVLGNSLQANYIKPSIKDGLAGLKCSKRRRGVRSQSE